MRGNFAPFSSKSFQIRDHFFPLHLPKATKNLKCLDIDLWEVGTKRRLNGVNKWRKKIVKKTYFDAAIWHPLWAKVFKSETITFPKRFWKSKNFGHWTSGSGGKKTFKRSEQMKKSVKTFFFVPILHPLWAKVFKSKTTSFHYFSPMTLKILKVWTLDFEKWVQKDR